MVRSDDGVPAKNWVQCTSKDCNKHEDCLCRDSDDNLVCVCVIR